MIDPQIRKVQLLQLEMIKKLHLFCTEHQLCYTLLGGSLLGAIRHKGFIPWDDDLDIGLPRPDYERLILLLKEQPIEGCFLQNYETDPHFTQPFAKLRMNGTIYREAYIQNLNVHHGIFIDIFPLDRISSPGSPEVEFRRLISKLITFAIWRKEGCRITRIGWKKLEAVSSFLIGLLPKKKLISIQNWLVIRNRPQWNYWGSMFSSNYPTSKVYFTTEELENLVLLDFEDTKLYGPAAYDRVLSSMFRNYMKLPPESKRSSGHDVVEIRF